MAEYIKKSIAIAIVNDAKDVLSFEKIGAAIQITAMAKKYIAMEEGQHEQALR